MAAKEMEKDTEVSTKKRGRPKGSKNKTKAEMTAAEQVSAAGAASEPDPVAKTPAKRSAAKEKPTEASSKTEAKKASVKRTAAKKEEAAVEKAVRESTATAAASRTETKVPGSDSEGLSKSDPSQNERLVQPQKDDSKNNRRGNPKSGEPKGESAKSKNKNCSKNNAKRKKPTTTYVQSLVGMVEVPAEGTARPEYPRIPERSVESAAPEAEEESRELGAVKEQPQTSESSVQEDTTKDINGIKVEGIFEMSDQSYGFLRKNGISSENDIYVSPMFTKKFNLKNGEFVRGVAKKESTDKYRPLLYVTDVNGVPAYTPRSKHKFDDMTPQFPRERFHLSNGRSDIAMRIIDLIAPVGKGQRGLIVAPPKSGKTILLQKIAKSIRANYPEVELMILLIDERPEEVTDMKDEVDAPVYYSTFDELPTNHIRIAELVLNRARGLVEMGRDVVILLDSITRLARAYNIALPASGRTLSGGLDTNALHKPKRFLGSARNMIEGGSLTIMATALIETGSKMDDVIFEEFKGTGNMELILDRKLSEKRIFPSIDIKRSGTRREELLLNREEYEAILKLRRALDQNGGNEPVELLSEELMKTRDNAELIQWINNVFTDKHLRK